MLDWIFNLFRFNGKQKTATTTKNLTKKADIAPEDIQSGDSLEAVQNAISGVRQARDAQRQECEAAGNIVSQEQLEDPANKDIYEQLLTIYRANMQRVDFVMPIVAELERDSSVQALLGAQAKINGPLYQLAQAHVDEGVIYDAIEAYVYNFMKNFNIANPKVKSLFNSIYKYVSDTQAQTGNEHLELSDYVVKQLQKYPDYTGMSKAELTDLYNDAVDAVYERKRPKQEGEKKAPSGWSPVVNPIYKRVNDILKQHKFNYVGDSTGDAESIFTALSTQLAKMCAASIHNISATQSPITNAIRNLYKVPTSTEKLDSDDNRDKVGGNNDDEKVGIDVAAPEDDVQVSNIDRIYRMRDAVFKALERYAGNDPRKLAWVKTMQNSVQESIESMTKKEDVRGGLDRYKAQCKQLAKAGFPVFDRATIKDIFKKAYDNVKVQDPAAKGKQISLGQLKADLAGISAAIYLTKLNDKKGKGYNDGLSQLDTWYKFANPQYRKDSEYVHKLYDDLTANGKAISQLHSQRADLANKGEPIPAEMENTLTRLEEQREDLLDKYEVVNKRIEPVTVGLRKTPGYMLLEQLGVQHGGKANPSSANTQSLIKQLANLKRKYQYQVTAEADRANKEAQKYVVDSYLKNQRDVFENLGKINDAVSGKPLSEVPGLKASLSAHYADIVRRLISERNVSAIEDFLQDTVENPVKGRRPTETPKLTNKQLDLIYKSQNDSDMADYLTWFIDRHTKDMSFLKNRQVLTAMRDSMGSTATMQRIKDALMPIFTNPASINSLIANGSEGSVDYATFAKYLIAYTTKDVNTFKKETGKDVSFAPYFEPQNVASFLENAVQSGVLRPFTDSTYGELDSLERRLAEMADKYSVMLDRAYHKYSNPTSSTEDKQAAESRISDIAALLKDPEMWRRFDNDFKDLERQLEYSKDDYALYNDIKSSIATSRESYNKLKNVYDLASNFSKNPEVRDSFGDMLNGDAANDKPLTQTIEQAVGKEPEEHTKTEADTFIDAYPDMKIYFDGDRYFKTVFYAGGYKPTTTPYTLPVLPQDKVVEYAVPSVKEEQKRVVKCDGKWYSLDEATGRPVEEIYEPKRKEEIKPITEEPKQEQPTEAPKPDQINEEPKQEQHLEEPQQEATTKEEPKEDLTDSSNGSDIPDEEPFIRNSGFTFKGIHRSSGFKFLGTPQMIFKFAKSTDGIDAFTSPEDVQKTIEQPFGTAQTPSETAIQKQRAISPDNTSIMGQTSIQEDQEANKSFSSKQITKALKAAYDKDKNLFNELVNIIANTGSTGTFCSAIVALLPKVNWVNEAAIREYNKTAQDPVHRNSFQHALEKAMEEQLKKHPEFEKICKSILSGQPVK